MWGGRYANGPVAVEHLVDPTTVPALPAGSSPVVLQDCKFTFFIHLFQLQVWLEIHKVAHCTVEFSQFPRPKC